MRVGLLILIISATLWGGDARCPVYPSSAWSVQSDPVALESLALTFSNGSHEPKAISAAALLNDLSTQIHERRITAAWGFRATRKFYSILAVSDGNTIIAEYSNRSWNPNLG
jgi:hypothetical protein